MMYLPEVSPLVVLPPSLSPYHHLTPYSSLKFGKGKGPAKKSKGSDDDDGDSDAGSTTNGDTSGRYIIEVW